MIYNRKKYVRILADKQWNGRIKVITGLRRCGKSTVLFELFKSYLLETGVRTDHILEIALDSDENEKYRDPYELAKFIREKCDGSDDKYYLFLDEIQYAISKEELRNYDEPVRLYSVLNGFLHMKNIDVYVTGSNSKLLSKDVSTEFRGRGDTVHIYPLTFSEFLDFSGLEKHEAYDEYLMFGGMPYLLSLDTDEKKYNYFVTV